jgi:hypothetical protein
MNRKTRGKPSKIKLLPAAIKTKLDELLRDGKMTQAAIVDHVNVLIIEAGLSADEQISKPGINRYSTQMHTAGQRIAEARAVSEQWVAKLGDAPSGDVSQILIEMVRTLAFEQVLNKSQSGDAVEPKFIKDLATGIEKLEKAASTSHKRAKEIRSEFASQAADAAAEVGKQAGLTQDGISLIKREILGIV